MKMLLISGMGSEDREDSRRLTGWSEIASYLEVSVRTAQTWEKKNGLPVHRLESGNRSFVIAYEEELESWLPTGESCSQAGLTIRSEAITICLVLILIVVTIFALMGWYCCLSCSHDFSSVTDIDSLKAVLLRHPPARRRFPHFGAS